MPILFHLPIPTPQPRTWASLTAGVKPDFLTPDGHIIPRATGEAALRTHQAVLVGDLLVLAPFDHSSTSKSGAYPL